MQAAGSLLLMIGGSLISGSLWGQILLFQENVGVPRAATTISAYTGWSAAGAVQFVGNAEVRTTQASVNYTLASGGGNIFFSAVPGQYLQIDQIPTQMNQCLTIGFGLFKSTTGSNAADFLVDVSTNGTTYNSLPISLPVGTGTAVWSYISKSLCIDPALKLSLRFRQTGNSTYYRVDDISVSVFTPLPVEILTFKGFFGRVDNRLVWETVSETNNQGFYVERSADGIHFQQIGFVSSLSAGGNSQSILKYHFTDAKPSGNRHYYRLCQLDLDGNRSVSNIITIQSNLPNEIEWMTLYPNPCTGPLNLLLYSPSNQSLRIRLLDLSGRVLLNRSLNIHSGRNIIPLDLNTQPPGSYVVDVGGTTRPIIRL